MALLNFKRKDAPATTTVSPQVEAFLQDYSIEVMPRTAEKVENFRDLLPEGTRVYIAHIEGTPIDDMVATAKRLNDDGFKVMHIFPPVSSKTAQHSRTGLRGTRVKRMCGRLCCWLVVLKARTVILTARCS